MKKSAIEQAIDICGMYGIAKKLKITVPSVAYWKKKKMLPRTEWTGETNYSDVIEEMTNGKVTKEMLLKDKVNKK